MAGYNRIILMGNLTRDPEHKALASGQAVCRLGLATNRQFKNKQTGTMVQEVCYVDVDVWGPQAESCRQYLQKGRAVLVEGRLKLDSWEDAEGKSRNKHVIVADRVVFVSSGAAAGVEAEEGEPVGAARRTGADALMDDATDAPFDAALAQQLKDVKARAQAKSAPKPPKAAKTEDVGFKDEPPFQDDLPF
jgi:single-strand DNA-binding protein